MCEHIWERVVSQSDSYAELKHMNIQIHCASYGEDTM
jgi:hypothetical protein